MSALCVMKAMIRICPPHRGHSSGNSAACADSVRGVTVIGHRPYHCHAGGGSPRDLRDLPLHRHCSLTLSMQRGSSKVGALVRRRSPVRRVRCQHTEVAVSVRARGRNERGNALDQLQWREVQLFACFAFSTALISLAALRSRSIANGGRAQYRSSRSRPARSCAAMQTLVTSSKFCSATAEHLTGNPFGIFRLR